MQGVGEKGAEAVLPLDILWTKMKDIVSQAVKLNGGASVVEALISRLERIGSRGGNYGEMEAAGAGGMVVQYSPTFNLYGNASKKEVAETEKMSRAEFARMMKQYEKDNRRSKFKSKK